MGESDVEKQADKIWLAAAPKVMKLAGVDATAKRIDREDRIEYTITIRNSHG